MPVSMRIRHPFSDFSGILLTSFIISFSLVATGQETSTCAENLKNAQALFESGQVEKVPEMLQSCLKSGFTREEQLSAYKLLIQSYLFEDKLSRADSTMMDFLKKNPEYELSPTDHSSFVNLYNTFRVRPVIQLSVHLGTNLPFLTFIDKHPAMGIPGTSTYTSKALNLYGSLEAKYELTGKLELNVEAGFSQIKFTNTEGMPGLEDAEFGKTTYNESQNRIELPLSMTYDFKTFGRFTLYGRLGAGPALNLSTTATVEHRPSYIGGGGVLRTGSDLSRNDSRIALDVFTQAGAGIKFKIRGGYIVAELRTSAGFMNQVIRGREEAAEVENELASFYMYADDDFHVNTSNFTVGYTQIFYKPSKRK